MRKLLISLTILILVLGFFSFIPIQIVNASGEKWLIGWGYRKSHVVNAAAGAGTDYQVKVGIRYNATSSVIEPESKSEDKGVNGANAWDSQERHFVVDRIVDLGSGGGGSPNALMWSTDGGANYATRWTPPENEYLFGRFIHIDSRDYIFVCTEDANGQNRKVYRSINGGASFSVVTGLNNVRPWNMVEDSNGHLYTGNYGLLNEAPAVYKSTNGGANWASISDSGWAGSGSWNTHVHNVRIDPQTGWLYVSIGDVGSTTQRGLWRSKLKDGSDWVRKYSTETVLGVVCKGSYVYESTDQSGTNGRVLRFQDDGTGNIQTFTTVLDIGTDRVSYYMNIDPQGAILVSFLNEINSASSFIYMSRNGTTWTKVLEVTGKKEFTRGTWVFRDDCDLMIGRGVASSSRRIYFDVNCQFVIDEKCRSDFGDIRFTDDDGETELSYWMERKVDKDYAIFWVKVADDLSSQAQTIYVYYGNAQATATSNAQNTWFAYFDAETSLPASLTARIAGSGTVTVSGGTIVIASTSQAADIAFIKNTNPLANHSLVLRWKVSAYTWGLHYFATNNWTGTDAQAGDDCHTNFAGNDNLDWHDENNILAEITTWSADNYLWVKIEKRGTTVEWFTSTDGISWTSVILSDGVHADLDYVEIGDMLTNYWGSRTVTIDVLRMSKFVSPEPSHGAWGSEETRECIMIDNSFVSDTRSDVGSFQTVGFHAKWNNNGSNVVGGNIYVNGTEYLTNSTGWINVCVYSSKVGKEKWIVAGVNCGGVTTYIQAAQSPSIVWDQIKIIDGGVTKESAMQGETATIWFKALYEYDNSAFNDTNGVLYVNGSAMVWSTTNSRWEHNDVATSIGIRVFMISGVYDRSYNLIVINDKIGPQTINIWSSPFSVISNSTISELVLNSGSKILSFTVSGPSGTIGCTIVTIANTLVEDISQLEVYLDGTQINYAVTSTDYSWLIHFTYQHSTHEIVMSLGSSQAKPLMTTPFEITIISGIALVLFLISACAILVYLNKSRSTRKKLIPEDNLRSTYQIFSLRYR
jgi:hypothetical protein